jgi:3-hydroxyisobutyrate dehydrogenase-like beta-hydroxyacid dehydrogenase
MERLRISLIDLGIMGHHMAPHLMRAAFWLVVYSIVRSAMDPLVAMGATPAGFCGEVANHSDVIITMVPDSTLRRTLKRQRSCKTYFVRSDDSRH